jgi:hypothetical protein
MFIREISRAYAGAINLYTLHELFVGKFPCAPLFRQSVLGAAKTLTKGNFPLVSRSSLFPRHHNAIGIEDFLPAGNFPRIVYFIKKSPQMSKLLLKKCHY